MPRPLRAARGARRALTLLSAAVLFIVPWAGAAYAHGTVTAPVSRNYGCYQRWSSDWQDPAMQQQDPMCWQAWQDNPNAMWNWMSIYQNGLGGQFQQKIPDGQLCSGGLSGDGLYRSLDKPGPWKMTDLSASNFSVTLYDQGHGADYLLVYVTKQGYDATTQPLRWSDLELIKKTGKYASTGGPGSYTVTGLSAPGRTGRHVVYTVWQRTGLDQAFFFCSDVNFS
ncbi:lytic polysaccharide monooxygenase [Actinoallomurus acanthiterrae]